MFTPGWTPEKAEEEEGAMSRWKGIVAFALVVAGCLSAAPAQAETRYKLSIVLSELSPWYEGAVMFADLVKARTDGKIVIDVYPNQQLSAGDLVKGLQMLQ